MSYLSGIGRKRLPHFAAEGFCREVGQALSPANCFTHLTPPLVTPASSIVHLDAVI